MRSITDPPYEEKELNLLRDLAHFADRVLKPGGVLAVMYPQDRLPQAFERLSVGRTYRWTMCVMVSRKGWLVHPRKVLSSWKPVLIFGGGRLVSDVIEVPVDDIDDARTRHPHGQSLGAFREVVERLTRPGDLVVDPCMGGGTTLLAATLARSPRGRVRRRRRLRGEGTKAARGRDARAIGASTSRPVSHRFRVSARATRALARPTFGSSAPFSRCPRHVRSAPNTHRDSGHPG